jgi:hypothetical protein
MSSVVKFPRNRKGERNPFCPKYGECLNEAAKKLWTFLDCSGCENRSTRDSGVEATECLSGDSMQIHDLPSGMDDQY